MYITESYEEIVYQPVLQITIYMDSDIPMAGNKIVGREDF